MTSPPSTNSNDKVKSDPANSQGAYSQDSSLIKLLVISLIAGLVIVAYVLIIVKVESSRKKIDPFDKTTELVAKELTKVTVQNSRFGIIGLVDTRLSEDVSYSMEPPIVHSLNSVGASLKAAAELAKELKSEYLQELIAEDIAVYNSLQHQLWTKLNNSIQKDTNSNRIYQIAFETLKKKLPNNCELLDLKLTLGGAGRESGRATKVHCQSSELSEPFVDNGFYKDNLSIPVLNEHYIRFYNSFNGCKIADSQNFIIKSEDMLPSAVLMEVTIKKKVSKDFYSNENKSVCSLIGSPALEKPPTCLTLNFPQGFVEKFETIRALTSTDTFDTKGNWGQATGGSIPGAGSLSPTIEPVLDAQAPDKAVVASLYSWIKTMPEAPDATRLKDLLDISFKPEKPKRGSKAEANSFLAFDTGARQRAFLKNTNPGSQGQLALASCFEFPGSSTSFPSSSVPLIVDNKGVANLSGRIGFHKELVQNYLESIYQTNLCAVETLSQAKRTAKKYQSKLNDNNSVDKDFCKRVIEVSRKAGKAGLNVATKSFEIAQRNFSLCKNGLHYIEKPNPAYLVGRKYIFAPMELPLSEEDLVSHAENKNKVALNWLARADKVMMDWKNFYKGLSYGIKIDGKPLDLVLSEKVHPVQYLPTTVIFDSRDILSKGQIFPHMGTVYPFKGEPLQENQSIYYCQNAFHTGKDTRVNWSILIRNNSFHKNTDKTGTRYKRKKTIWCNKFNPTFSTFPNLASEVQIRRPLPEVKDVPISTLVVDPSFDRKVPVVPPVPAHLM